VTSGEAGDRRCATHSRRPTPAPTIVRYVLAESLPPETQICVRQDPFRGDLACLALGELRHTMRTMRRAALEVR
jgi:hypothetical protein